MRPFSSTQTIFPPTVPTRFHGEEGTPTRTASPWDGETLEDFSTNLYPGWPYPIMWERGSRVPGLIAVGSCGHASSFMERRDEDGEADGDILKRKGSVAAWDGSPLRGSTATNNP